MYVCIYIYIYIYAHMIANEYMDTNNAKCRVLFLIASVSVPCWLPNVHLVRKLHGSIHPLLLPKFVQSANVYLYTQFSSKYFSSSNHSHCVHLPLLV